MSLRLYCSSSVMYNLFLRRSLMLNVISPSSGTQNDCFVLKICGEGRHEFRKLRIFVDLNQWEKKFFAWGVVPPPPCDGVEQYLISRGKQNNMS